MNQAGAQNVVQGGRYDQEYLNQEQARTEAQSRRHKQYSGMGRYELQKSRPISRDSKNPYRRYIHMSQPR